MHFSIGLTLLTIFDAVLVWLTWREYQAKRTRRHPDKPPRPLVSDQPAVTSDFGG